jgi:hypothetical protein
MMDERRKAMKVWGIRLIGMFFLVGAILNLFGIITGINPPHGFMGLSWVSSSIEFDIMAWIGTFVFAYIGYHLLKLRSQGRIWALILLWISVLRIVFAFIYTAIKIPAPLTSITLVANYPGHSYTLDKPGIFLVLMGISFLFFAIPTYFLMRKDVKMEF